MRTWIVPFFRQLSDTPVTTDSQRRTFAPLLPGQLLTAHGSNNGWLSAFLHDQVKCDLQILQKFLSKWKMFERNLCRNCIWYTEILTGEYKYSLLCKSIVSSEQGKKCNLFWQSDFLVNLEILCNSSKNYWVNDLIFTLAKITRNGWRGNSWTINKS